MCSYTMLGHPGKHFLDITCNTRDRQKVKDKRDIFGITALDMPIEKEKTRWPWLRLPLVIDDGRSRSELTGGFTATTIYYPTSIASDFLHLFTLTNQITNDI